MSRDYLANERFIHKELCYRAQQSVNHLYEIWKKDGKIMPVLLTWPAEPIRDDVTGKPIEGICALDLPEPIGERVTSIRKMVEKTKAYALLLAEERNGSVKVILESPHGTRCWTLPIHQSADVRFLGEATIEDDKERVGLLWSPETAEA